MELKTFCAHFQKIFFLVFSLEMNAGCSQNVYFMGSILTSYQAAAQNSK